MHRCAGRGPHSLFWPGRRPLRENMRRAGKIRPELGSHTGSIAREIRHWLCFECRCLARKTRQGAAAAYRRICPQCRSIARPYPTCTMPGFAPIPCAIKPARKARGLHKGWKGTLRAHQKKLQNGLCPQPPACCPARTKAFLFSERAAGGALCPAPEATGSESFLRGAFTGIAAGFQNQ